MADFHANGGRIIPMLSSGFSTTVLTSCLWDQLVTGPNIAYGPADQFDPKEETYGIFPV
jgi:hypothetical protein